MMAVRNRETMVYQMIVFPPSMIHVLVACVCPFHAAGTQQRKRDNVCVPLEKTAGQQRKASANGHCCRWKCYPVPSPPTLGPPFPQLEFRRILFFFFLQSHGLQDDPAK